MSNIYYVYAYLRNTDSKTAKAGTPYYIGMGSKNRAFSKHHNSIPLPKNKKHIVILENNLTQIGAYSLERRYLKWYGRKDLKTGILINRSGGGPGINQVSKITKKIMSDNGMHYKIYNLAMGGDLPSKRLSQIDKLASFNPKLVIYGVGLRDFQRNNLNTESFNSVTGFRASS